MPRPEDHPGGTLGPIADWLSREAGLDRPWAPESTTREESVVTADPKQSRGYRNKNPGNIDYRPDSDPWQGQVGLGDAWLPQPRRRFAEFREHVWGIRALARLLITYQDRHKLRSPQQIISRYAPANENDTGAYVRAVAQAVGVGPNTVLDLHTYEHLRPLVAAIIRHELGGMPYDDATLDRGLELAGVPRPVHTVAEAASTGTGRGAITVASAAAGAAAVGEAVKAFAGVPQWTAVALIVCAAALAALWLLTRAPERAGLMSGLLILLRPLLPHLALAAAVIAALAVPYWMGRQREAERAAAAAARNQVHQVERERDGAEAAADARRDGAADRLRDGRF